MSLYDLAFDVDEHNTYVTRCTVHTVPVANPSISPSYSLFSARFYFVLTKAYIEYTMASPLRRAQQKPRPARSSRFIPLIY